MARTLTGLIPTLYRPLDVVSRELTGMITSVTLDNGVQNVGKDQTINIGITQQGTLEDATPGANPADSGDQDITPVAVTISNEKVYPIRYSGDEQKKLNTSMGYMNALQNDFAQGFRTLANALEADLVALYAKASRAAGTAGTTPFATVNDMTDIANVEKILVDNGAPGDRSLVLNTTDAAPFMGKNAGADFQGSDTFLRQGILSDHYGINIKRSGQLSADHTAGTGSSATTDNAGYAIGDTVITLASAGTGTILAGDVITFAGDSNQYVVTSGDADVSGGGTITLAAPGLRQAIAASTTAITVKADYSRNIALSRDAMIAVVRQPSMPEEGDRAEDVMTITDQRSGLTFQIAMYTEYRRIKYEVGLAWGVQMVKPEHSALLIG